MQWSGNVIFFVIVINKNLTLRPSVVLTRFDIFDRWTAGIFWICSTPCHGCRAGWHLQRRYHHDWCRSRESSFGDGSALCGRERTRRDDVRAGTLRMFNPRFSRRPTTSYALTLSKSRRLRIGVSPALQPGEKRRGEDRRGEERRYGERKEMASDTRLWLQASMSSRPASCRQITRRVHECVWMCSTLDSNLLHGVAITIG